MQPGLQRKLQDSQDYTEEPCLKIDKKSTDMLLVCLETASKLYPIPLFSLFAKMGNGHHQTDNVVKETGMRNLEPGRH